MTKVTMNFILALLSLHGTRKFPTFRHLQNELPSVMNTYNTVPELDMVGAVVERLRRMLNVSIAFFFSLFRRSKVTMDDPLLHYSAAHLPSLIHKMLTLGRLLP